MSVKPINQSNGVSLAWAWKLIDRRRNRENITPHQIEFALAAIANLTGRSPISGSPTYDFDDEATLRARHSAK